MNKKTKAIIALATVAVVAIVVGVLCWGLQPVQREQVTLKTLNKKLGAKYCMPSELPFDGDVECYVVYVEAHMGVVLTRFEINPNRSTGYSIKLKDSNREIYIETGASITINAEAAESLLIENYNDQKIEYLFIETETNNTLTTLFEINGKAYYINAAYNKDVNSETLKSDMECLLIQMIKQ